MKHDIRVIENGDIFKSRAQTLVNTVNTVGVMGKGISLQFKRRFHDMYEDYVGRCRRGLVKLGRPYLYRRPTLPWILNFPTKGHWRSVARLEDIVRGLNYLETHYKEWGITSLAVPPLGSGEGQLEWRVVGPTLYQHLRRLEVPVELYAPFRTPHQELEPTYLEQPMLRLGSEVPPSRVEPGWIAVLEALSRLEQEPYHWPIGRISFQKIAYFATEAGIRTGVHFIPGSFGPFSPQLKKTTSKLVNNGLILERERGRMFEVRVGPTYEAARKAYANDLEANEDAIRRLVDLFSRMNTRQAEVAATVHFAAKQIARGGRLSEAELLREVKRWKTRRTPKITETELAVAIRNLTALRWLDLRPSRELPIEAEVHLEA